MQCSAVDLHMEGRRESGFNTVLSCLALTPNPVLSCTVVELDRCMDGQMDGWMDGGM